MPVGQWFQVEGSTAQDTTAGASRLDGRPPDRRPRRPADRPMSWVAWDVCSNGLDLMPGTAVLYLDDCAVSRSRVGPTGLLAGVTAASSPVWGATHPRAFQAAEAARPRRSRPGMIACSTVT